MQNTLYERALISLTATMLALPNGVIIWFLVMYPVYGVTGVFMHPFFHFATFFIACLLILVWSAYGSQNLAEVIYRSCRFGAILALFLPVITGMVSLFWALGVIGRPPAVLPELSALEIPVHAAAAAMILILLFLAGSFMAAKRLDRVRF